MSNFSKADDAKIYFKGGKFSPESRLLPEYTNFLIEKFQLNLQNVYFVYLHSSNCVSVNMYTSE